MTTERTQSTVPYNAAEMWALVADVEKYPLFIPYCIGLRIISRDTVEGSGVVIADMLVAYKVFREQFRSRVSLDRDQHRIDVDYVDGPFRHLSTNWQFTDQDGGGCLVDFAVSFEFRNRLLQSTAQRVFDKAFRKMVDAFVERAKAVYGGREMPQATTQNTTPEKPTDTDVVLATKPA